MLLSDAELNRCADYIVALALTCRIHTGDPGGAGIDDRIGTLSKNLAAASWSDAANGDVQYNADVPFGVLDADANQTPSHCSVWRGNAFVGRAALSSSVLVIAGGTFKINAGTIAINGETGV